MSVVIRLIAIFAATTSTVFVNGFAGDEATIILDYPGALFILDEKEIPTEESDSIPIEPGKHHLTLYFPASGKLWLPPIKSRQFTLGEDESLAIKKESIRYLNITTSPSGAEIYLNDQLLGETPLALSLLPTDLSIQIRKEGYRDSMIELDQIRERSSNLNRVLEPLTSTDTAISTRQVDGRWSHWIPYMTLSYFVTSTAFGFYSKSRSDDLFDEYLRTSSREEMNRLYERANALDNRARVFWITGQVALGATIYLFIRSYRLHSTERPLPSLGLRLSGDEGGEIFLSLAFGGGSGHVR